MSKLSSTSYIAALQKKWNRQIFVGQMLRTIAFIILALAILLKFVESSYGIVAGIFIMLFALLPALFGKKINEPDVIRFLNEAYPNLEESAQLLLKPAESLNRLERLQLNKVQTRIPAEPDTPLSVSTKLKSAAILFAFAVLAGIIILKVPVTSSDFIKTGDRGANAPTSMRPETRPAVVAGVAIKISPPLYMRKTPREQQNFNIIAEQGAKILWTISTTSSVQQLPLVFNDGSVLQLQPADKNRTKWTGSKVLKRSGFYQVRTGNDLSELYQVEMLRDQLPVIVVQSPKPNTLIEYGSPQTIQVTITVSDDYGVETAAINATIASGSGEAVKFKEQQLSFPNFKQGNKEYQLKKQLDLPSLGMQPGDELYLYFRVKDNYQQEKRSDVYIIRLEDTTQLMSMDGLLGASNVKPEFFRSERQIIIETEQLIKDRDTISVEGFNKKSADLGLDQKLLRLRYGKFLGEESDAEEAGHDEAGSNPSAVPGNADHILDQYSHRHDNAEDPAFFDANTKKQLLATLSEMWKAELQLRTLKPKDALPFEYKALRLLKELQQSTRVYVAKTGSKTTPLKPELRLTGDLAKIGEPVIEQKFSPATDQTSTLRKALGILEQVRSRETLQRTSTDILRSTSVQLSERAAAQPAAYLASLEALRRILQNKFTNADIDLVGSALQKMIRQVSNAPQRSKAAPDMNLSKRYFLNLNRKYD